MPARNTLLVHALDPRDAGLIGEFKMHMSPLRRQQMINVMTPAEITASTEFGAELKQLIDGAEIILLAISPAFMLQDATWNIMEEAMRRRAAGLVKVIPVNIRPVEDWNNCPCGNLSPLPQDPGGKTAVSEWADRDVAWVKVCSGIRAVLEKMG